MSDWFNITYTCVVWNSDMSETVQFSSATRQGGILSPFFFAVYVDNFPRLLENSNTVKVNCVNARIYADDLILTSLTTSDQRALITL